MYLKDLMEIIKGKKISDIELYVSNKTSCIDIGKGNCLEFKDLYNHKYYEVVNYVIANKKTYSNIFSDDCYIDEWWDDDSDGVLIVLIKNDVGIIPSEEIWDEVQEGRISEEILGEVCYFFSKKAKQYRWNSNNEIKETKDNLYWKKEQILDKFFPISLHYDEINKFLYSYYNVGKRFFHRPIGRCESLFEKESLLKDMKKNEWLNLQTENVGILIVDEENDVNMYCERFCEFVLENYIDL